MGAFLYIYMALRGKVWDAEKRPFFYFTNEEVNNLSQPQHLECDTPDCIHWKDGECAKETSVTIQEHHCVDYEEQIILPTTTVTIEISDGRLQNVYASPDLPTIFVELIDIDDLQQESEEAFTRGQQLLEKIAQAHKHIF